MNYPLLEMAERAPLAPASREAFAHILPTLAEREYQVFRALHELMARYPDATGGEIAAHLGVPVTSVRPRLTAMLKDGLIEKAAIRCSRVAGELRCHPVKPTVPLSAIVRAESKRRLAS